MNWWLIAGGVALLIYCGWSWWRASRAQYPSTDDVNPYYPDGEPWK